MASVKDSAKSAAKHAGRAAKATTKGVAAGASATDSMLGNGDGSSGAGEQISDVKNAAGKVAGAVKGAAALARGDIVSFVRHLPDFLLVLVVIVIVIVMLFQMLLGGFLALFNEGTANANAKMVQSYVNSVNDFFEYDSEGNAVGPFAKAEADAVQKIFDTMATDEELTADQMTEIIVQAYSNYQDFMDQGSTGDFQYSKDSETGAVNVLVSRGNWNGNDTSEVFSSNESKSNTYNYWDNMLLSLGSSASDSFAVLYRYKNYYGEIQDENTEKEGTEKDSDGKTKYDYDYGLSINTLMALYQWADEMYENKIAALSPYSQQDSTDISEETGDDEVSAADQENLNAKARKELFEFLNKTSTSFGSENSARYLKLLKVTEVKSSGHTQWFKGNTDKGVSPTLSVQSYIRNNLSELGLATGTNIGNKYSTMPIYYYEVSFQSPAVLRQLFQELIDEKFANYVTANRYLLYGDNSFLAGNNINSFTATGSYSSGNDGMTVSRRKSDVYHDDNYYSVSITPRAPGTITLTSSDTYAVNYVGGTREVGADKEVQSYLGQPYLVFGISASTLYSAECLLKFTDSSGEKADVEVYVDLGTHNKNEGSFYYDVRTVLESEGRDTVTVEKVFLKSDKITTYNVTGIRCVSGTYSDEVDYEVITPQIFDVERGQIDKFDMTDDDVLTAIAEGYNASIILNEAGYTKSDLTWQANSRVFYELFAKYGLPEYDWPLKDLETGESDPATMYYIKESTGTPQSKNELYIDYSQITYSNKTQNLYDWFNAYYDAGQSSGANSEGTRTDYANFAQAYFSPWAILTAEETVNVTRVSLNEQAGSVRLVAAGKLDTYSSTGNSYGEFDLSNPLISQLVVDGALTDDGGMSFGTYYLSRWSVFYGNHAKLLKSKSTELTKLAARSDSTDKYFMVLREILWNSSYLKEIESIAAALRAGNSQMDEDESMAQAEVDYMLSQGLIDSDGNIDYEKIQSGNYCSTVRLYFYFGIEVEGGVYKWLLGDEPTVADQIGATGGNTTDFYPLGSGIQTSTQSKITYLKVQASIDNFDDNQGWFSALWDGLTGTDNVSYQANCTLYLKKNAVLGKISALDTQDGEQQANLCMAIMDIDPQTYAANIALDTHNSTDNTSWYSNFYTNPVYYGGNSEALKQKYASAITTYTTSTGKATSSGGLYTYSLLFFRRKLNTIPNFDDTGYQAQLSSGWALTGSRKDTVLESNLAYIGSYASFLKGFDFTKDAVQAEGYLKSEAPQNSSGYNYFAVRDKFSKFNTQYIYYTKAPSQETMLANNNIAQFANILFKMSVSQDAAYPSSAMTTERGKFEIAYTDGTSYTNSEKTSNYLGYTTNFQYKFTVVGSDNIGNSVGYFNTFYPYSAQTLAESLFFPDAKELQVEEIQNDTSWAYLTANEQRIFSVWAYLISEGVVNFCFVQNLVESPTEDQSYSAGDSVLCWPLSSGKKVADTIEYSSKGEKRGESLKVYSTGFKANVVAPGDGKVVKVSQNVTSGTWDITFEIDNVSVGNSYYANGDKKSIDETLTVTYSGLIAKPTVKAGTYVIRGQTVAYIDQTIYGRKSGTYKYFYVRINLPQYLKDLGYYSNTYQYTNVEDFWPKSVFGYQSFEEFSSG